MVNRRNSARSTRRPWTHFFKRGRTENVVDDNGNDDDDDDKAQANYYHPGTAIPFSDYVDTAPFDVIAFLDYLNKHSDNYYDSITNWDDFE